MRKFMVALAALAFAGTIAFAQCTETASDWTGDSDIFTAELCAEVSGTVSVVAFSTTDVQFTIDTQFLVPGMSRSIIIPIDNDSPYDINVAWSGQDASGNNFVDVSSTSPEDAPLLISESGSRDFTFTFAIPAGESIPGVGTGTYTITFTGTPTAP